jgi:hypothetical protein
MADRTPPMTHATGSPVVDNTNIQTAGRRGPALLQDIWLIEIRVRSVGPLTEKARPEPGVGGTARAGAFMREPGSALADRALVEIDPRCLVGQPLPWCRSRRDSELPRHDPPPRPQRGRIELAHAEHARRREVHGPRSRSAARVHYSARDRISGKRQS